MINGYIVFLALNSSYLQERIPIMDTSWETMSEHAWLQDFDKVHPPPPLKLYTHNKLVIGDWPTDMQQTCGM